MISAVMATFAIAFAIVFIVCEILHFRHERELIRRLMTRDDAEYVKHYENENKKPIPPSPSVEAMKRWKAGKKG